MSINTKSNSISIIIPTFNEEKYIKNCLESILKNNLDNLDKEILIVDGGSLDKTKEIVCEFHKDYPFIRLLDNPKQIVPIAMNIGVKQAKGDIIIRMDAHTMYKNDYIKTLLKYFYLLNADNIGSVCRTKYFDDNSKSVAISKVLSNRFGVGNSLFRTGVNAPLEVDTVPFGCYRREKLLELGGFNEKLVRNQDIELNKRLKRSGGRILLIPYTECYYFARGTFKSLAKNNFDNGLWNILTIFITKDFKSLSIRHFVPLIFVFSILLFTVLGFFNKGFFMISAFILLIYFVSIFIISIGLVDAKADILNIIKAFFTLHFSYGFGSLKGLVISICNLIKRNY